MADNYLVQHGRMPYDSTDKSRKVYVSVSYGDPSLDAEMDEDDDDY